MTAYDKRVNRAACAGGRRRTLDTITSCRTTGGYSVWYNNKIITAAACSILWILYNTRYGVCVYVCVCACVRVYVCSGFSVVCDASQLYSISPADWERRPIKGRRSLEGRRCIYMSVCTRIYLLLYNEPGRFTFFYYCYYFFFPPVARVTIIIF